MSKKFICIHGQEAKTVMMDGERHALLDVDKKNEQAQIVLKGRATWVDFKHLSFAGKPLEAKHIRLPKGPCSKKAKNASQQQPSELQTVS